MTALLILEVFSQEDPESEPLLLRLATGDPPALWPADAMFSEERT